MLFVVKRLVVDGPSGCFVVAGVGLEAADAAFAQRVVVGAGASFEPWVGANVPAACQPDLVVCAVSPSGVGGSGLACCS